MNLEIRSGALGPCVYLSLLDLYVAIKVDTIDDGRLFLEKEFRNNYLFGSYKRNGNVWEQVKLSNLNNGLSMGQNYGRGTREYQAFEMLDSHK